jgi:hypothetical protein
MKKSNLTNTQQFNYNLAINSLKEIPGLEITTTPIQLKNGSIQILDTHTQRIFTITKVGYIRTHTTIGWDNKPITYQLNPKTPTKLIITRKYPLSRLIYPNSWFFMAYFLLIPTIKNIRKNK